MVVTLNHQYNVVEKPTVKAVLMGTQSCTKNLDFFDKIFVRRSRCRRFRNALYGGKILMGKCFV